MSYSCSVVIATRNRPAPLRKCLESIAIQSLLPSEVLVVDASEGPDTESLCDEVRGGLPFRLVHSRAQVMSAAAQRNDGARQSVGDLILFLDDDVVLEPDYIREMVAVFESDSDHKVGGVSGTIVNQTYSPPSWLNRILLRICIGLVPGPGTLVGPAVNMLPADIPNTRQRVQWLNSTGVAYRRDVFLDKLFPESYRGYSFMEDVHLSARVGLSSQLINTTNARLFHYDLGKKTHGDWKEHGRSMIVNRHSVMVGILRKNRPVDHWRLLMFEMVYGTLVSWRGNSQGTGWRRSLQMLAGRMSGYRQILMGRSPHFKLQPSDKSHVRA